MDKYTEHQLPSASTFRRNVKAVYENTKDKFQKEVNDDPIWFSIDETTDVNGNPTFTFVVGKLDTIGHRIEVHHADRPSKEAIHVLSFFQESMKVLKPMLHISNGTITFFSNIKQI